MAPHYTSQKGHRVPLSHKMAYLQSYISAIYYLNFVHLNLF